MESEPCTEKRARIADERLLARPTPPDEVRGEWSSQDRTGDPGDSAKLARQGCRERDDAKSILDAVETPDVATIALGLVSESIWMDERDIVSPRAEALAHPHGLERVRRTTGDLRIGEVDEIHDRYALCERLVAVAYSSDNNARWPVGIYA
jgi:hypothetical protein